LERRSISVKLSAMTTKTPRTERRAAALSKHRIVEAAIAILDADGEGALTFRTLATRLATGSGAIYWHVAGKNELLAEATNAVIAQVTTGEVAASDPHDAIRAIALGIFDAIDMRPWVGAHLARAPWQTAMLQIFEGVGRQLEALEVPEQAQFDAGSALVSYILGVAGQNATNARLHPPGTDRSAVLAEIAGRWTQHDPTVYPFVHRIARQLQEHDDRAQFLAGIDLIVAGIEAKR
jgi:AcrR family transcriptional regulator